MAEDTCSVEGCERAARCRGWCSTHYERWRTKGNPGPPVVKRNSHCAIEGCPRPARTRGWCYTHYVRWRKHGDPLFTMRPNYGTGPIPTSCGYLRRFAPDHPLADSVGYVTEHRKIAYDAGLLTDLTLQVHHINGDKTDNRLENLEVLSASEHTAQHLRENGYVTNQFGTWPLHRTLNQ